MDRQNSTLDDIAAVIGFTPTLRLAAWYGNTNNLYVPEIVTDEQILVRLLGRPAAERLAKAFPGEHIAVPRMTAYEEEERRCHIGRMLEKGFSMREVSKFERISERRVQQICRELEQMGIIRPLGPENPQGKDPSEKSPRKTRRTKPPRKSGIGKAAGQSTPGKAASEKPQDKDPSEKFEEIASPQKSARNQDATYPVEFPFIHHLGQQTP